MPKSRREIELETVLLERRLDRFVENSRYAAIPSLVSIVVLLVVFASYLAWPWRIVWGAGFGVILTIRLVLAHHPSFKGQDYESLVRRYRWAERTLVAGALAWAISLPMAAMLGGRSEVATFAALGATVLAAVLLMHLSLPFAARFHILVVGAGLGVGVFIFDGIGSWPILAMIVVSAACLLAAASGYERHFVAECEADLKRRQAERTIRMLLNDHESQAADWLWSIDDAGRIEDASEALAAAFGLPVATIEGEEFVSLLDPGRQRQAVATAIATRQAFRDTLVPITIGGERRLWRITGHPRGDGRMSGVGRDVTRQEEIEDRVRTMAFVDPLTGLANRNFFHLRLRDVLGATGEDGAPGGGRGSVLFSFDLDGFRAINDAQGHITGDSVLRECAHRLTRNLRSQDVAARVGGDEFMVLLESPGGDGLLIERAHRLLAALREPFHLGGQTMSLSACVGIYRAQPSTDPAEALRRVELALHAAKAKGRDTMALYDDALDRRARERRALEVDLRHAIDGDQLVLHYQPVVALPGLETVGYEALVRWNHPRRGLLLPEQFIGIAEESGLIGPMGDWVIARALEEAARWPGEFRVALNLSPSQVRNPRLIATVEAALAATGFPADRLEFEITEQVLMADVKAGTLLLERLRALGAVIALDDFGTGYASLSYLRQFRFERVKIDRSFVADLERADEARAIVSATTRLAEAIGMRTTAEGVETPEQLAMVRKLGCDEAQGFLIHSALPAAEIAAARAGGRGYPGAARPAAMVPDASRSSVR